MNRRQFLKGAATAAAVTAAVSIAAVGQQERYLVKHLGMPKGAPVASQEDALNWKNPGDREAQAIQWLFERHVFPAQWAV